ncbi:MAG: methyltransferase domain-containing protein [Hydrogenobaculum sp.]|nr:MAG: SAM-dependent methyltransferase [Hydrogenobaculum sp.]
MNKTLYEKYAIVQKQAANDLLEIIKHLNYETALDIGAGTGFLTKHMNKCVALDIDKSLKTYHKNFLIGNAEELPFKDKSFDIVVSNFALHLCELDLSIKEMIRVSKRYVACSFPVRGSLENWIYDFPDEKRVFELLKSKNIKVFEKKVYHLNFTKLELLKFINKTGKPKKKYSNYFIGKSQIKDILLKVENPSFVVLSFLIEV